MIPEKFKYKLYGRFKGRKKSYLLSSNEFKKNLINKDVNIYSKNYNILDIGSGSGENAVYLSFIHPQARIITCELFEDGNINLSNEIMKKNTDNIKIFQGNVLEFLDCIKESKIFNEIWILFPDPWPKVRHHKRRLLNIKFLELIYFYLKDSGRIFIATDSQTYIQSILSIIYKVRDYFIWENQQLEDWDYENLDLPKTKFFKKAKQSNRKSIFFQLKKI
jgi:tRNA (guanine-N7-)-methyltransferase|tara:strand:- start:103 stop:762 length:660 start_codon:yes stop_codon:yes gene_type:complete